jgi:hypothetical protein
MARATVHPDHQCISSEDVHGTTVYGADGTAKAGCAWEIVSKPPLRGLRHTLCATTHAKQSR